MRIFPGWSRFRSQRWILVPSNGGFLQWLCSISCDSPGRRQKIVSWHVLALVVESSEACFWMFGLSWNWIGKKRCLHPFLWEKTDHLEFESWLCKSIENLSAVFAAFWIAFRMDHYLPEVKQIVGLNDELDQQGFGIGLFRWLGWV